MNWPNLRLIYGGHLVVRLDENCQGGVLSIRKALDYGLSYVEPKDRQ